MIVSNYSWIGIHLIWILGWLLYKGFLMKSKAFTFNRMALYGILFSPFILLLNLSFPESTLVLNPLPELVLYENILEERSADLIGWTIHNIHLIIYFSISVLLLTRLILELIQVFKMKRKASRVEGEFGNYFEIPGAGAFCFFNDIFIGADQQDKALAYKHESIHASAWHSVDILLIRMMAVVFWIFPFWKKFEIYFKQNHEYYVDRKLLASDNLSLKQYVASIVDDGLSEYNLNALSGLYQLSLIKNRIEMMKSKNKFSLWRNVSFGILLCSGLFLASCQLDSQSNENEIISFATLDEAPKVSLENCEESSPVCFQKYLYGHISKEFSYPADAKEAGIAGKSFIQFTIAKTSEIINVELVKSSGHASLDKEALRLVNTLPDILEAGIKNGKHVATQFVVPISFQLKN